LLLLFVLVFEDVPVEAVGVEADEDDAEELNDAIYAFKIQFILFVYYFFNYYNL